jgi:hypothetical protein
MWKVRRERSEIKMKKGFGVNQNPFKFSNLISALALPRSDIVGIFSESFENPIGELLIYIEKSCH